MVGKQSFYGFRPKRNVKMSKKIYTYALLDGRGIYNDNSVTTG